MQVQFLVKVFMEREKTNSKMDPLTVPDMMPTATDEIARKDFPPQSISGVSRLLHILVDWLQAEGKTAT